MTIYGIGCNYSGEDELDAFLNSNVACMGHEPEEYPYFEGLFREIRQGDIIFLKSTPRGTHLLNIKAIGHVEVPNLGEKQLGFGVDVIWDVRSDELLDSIETTNDGGYHARRGTIFREYNPEIENRIMRIIRERRNG